MDYSLEDIKQLLIDQAKTAGAMGAGFTGIGDITSAEMAVRNAVTDTFKKDKTFMGGLKRGWKEGQDYTEENLRSLNPTAYDTSTAAGMALGAYGLARSAPAIAKTAVKLGSKLVDATPDVVKLAGKLVKSKVKQIPIKLERNLLNKEMAIKEASLKDTVEGLKKNLEKLPSKLEDATEGKGPYTGKELLKANPRWKKILEDNPLDLTLHGDPSGNALEDILGFYNEAMKESSKIKKLTTSGNQYGGATLLPERLNEKIKALGLSQNDWLKVMRSLYLSEYNNADNVDEVLEALLDSWTANASKARYKLSSLEPTAAVKQAKRDFDILVTDPVASKNFLKHHIDSLAKNEVDKYRYGGEDLSTHLNEWFGGIFPDKTQTSNNLGLGYSGRKIKTADMIINNPDSDPALVKKLGELRDKISPIVNDDYVKQRANLDQIASYEFYKNKPRIIEGNDLFDKLIEMGIVEKP